MAREMTDEARHKTSVESRQRAEAWVKQHFVAHEKEWRAYYAEVTAGANVGLPRGMYTRLTDALIADRDREYRRGLEAAAKVALEGCFDIGCTALEAEGIVRRTRDEIAKGIYRLAQEARR